MVHLVVPGPRRVRVVQVMATGTNGGAQEHVFNLVSRLDREFYDVSVVSLSNGSAVRKLERAGIETVVIDDPDDVITTATLAAYLADVRADVVHNHMYRAEIVGTKAVIALGDAGHRRPWLISTVHSSRVRSGEDQEAAAPADAADQPPGRRLPGDRGQDRERGPHRRPRQPDLQRRRPRAVRPPGALLHAPRGVRHGARRRDRGRGGPPGAGEGPPDPARGVAAGAGAGAQRLPAHRGRGQPARRAPPDRHRARGSSAT